MNYKIKEMSLSVLEDYCEKNFHYDKTFILANVEMKDLILIK